jgi:hypothetical protein
MVDDHVVDGAQASSSAMPNIPGKETQVSRFLRIITFARAGCAHLER